jgi:hypothetical protein
MNSQYVHYGCGLSAPQEWLNFDASPTLRLQKLPLLGQMAGGPKFPSNVRYGNIVAGLPVTTRTCRAVYCSHVLEHLSLSHFRIALTNTRSLLAEGGIFRLVVPDLRVSARRYLEDDGDTAAIRFMEETCLGVLERPRGLTGLLRTVLGSSQHLWMWDFGSMRRELEAAGFKAIRAARSGDSEEPLFAAVEEESRWVDAVGIQCYA